ncbi:MAG: nicotinamide mononucleotide transporter [Alphaproteobacteria bacterium]|nr:nicotinamide mononucleotide transporter [Alphaproteobacteria bacterium]
MISLEIGATIFGLLQGILVLLNKRSNWIFYIAQIICLLIFSYLNKLYGDVLSNSIYFVFGIIGWFLWKNEDIALISACSSKERLVYSSIIVFGTIIMFILLSKTQDPLPLIDSFTSVSSFIATYYMVRKKLDTWIIWFVNDICYVVQYGLLENQAVYLMGLNIVWTAMAVASFFNWLKIMKGYKNEKNIFCRQV